MSWRFQLLNKPYGSVTEGPVWDGENLLFTHISAGRIMRSGSGEITRTGLESGLP